MHAVFQQYFVMPLRFSFTYSVLCSVCVVALMTGCAGTYDQPTDLIAEIPDTWAQKAEAESIKESWLSEFKDAKLNDLVAEALASNIELAGDAAALDEARSSVTIAGADRWPSLNLALRGESASNQDSDTLTSSLTADWELDVWGKLSDTQRRSVETYLAAQAEYENARRQLAADVASGWFQLINDQNLYVLIDQRLQALQADLTIIESSYSQGIADALDVYLAQTSLLQEQASAEAQRQTVIESSARLQRLLGRYPSGDWQTSESLPMITANIPTGLPSELVTRRLDLQQSWHRLLSADAGLAIAHKNRFPRLSLTGRVSDTDDNLGDVFDADNLVESLVGNIALPLFQGGSLKAAEDVAAAQLKQVEQTYLGAVQDAFSEVETAISRQVQLEKRFDAVEGAQRNAQAGYELSFDQYRRGLVDYATVLQAQLRAFNTETSLLGLRNQLLQNRIALYQALGGGFAPSEQ